MWLPCLTCLNGCTHLVYTCAKCNYGVVNIQPFRVIVGVICYIYGDMWRSSTGYSVCLNGSFVFNLSSRTLPVLFYAVNQWLTVWVWDKYFSCKSSNSFSSFFIIYVSSVLTWLLLSRLHKIDRVFSLFSICWEVICKLSSPLLFAATVNVCALLCSKHFIICLVNNKNLVGYSIEGWFGDDPCFIMISLNVPSLLLGFFSSEDYSFVEL